MNGGALIGQGSFGCVFNPCLKCPGEKVSKDGIVSKVFFSEDSHKDAAEEIKIGSKINKIKGYEKWSHIWYKHCKPSTYDTLFKQDSEIYDCLYDNNVNEQEFNKHRRMLQGSYAGVSLLERMKKDFKVSTFTNKETFTKIFLQYMKLMKPLFIGLKEMYLTGISHNDIKDENIMVDKDGCKFIDFGLACEYKNKKFYENRSKSEFIHDRIYPPYPYEYIYLYATKGVLYDEQNDRQHKIYRSLHDRYMLIHGQIFHRETLIHINNLIQRYIDGLVINKPIKKPNKQKLLSLLDTYSLGMLIPSILCKLAKHLHKMKQLKQYLKLKPMNSFMDLFKHMTEPNYFDRFTPIEALQKYVELEKLYLSTSKKQCKRSNRK